MVKRITNKTLVTLIAIISLSIFVTGCGSLFYNYHTSEEVDLIAKGVSSETIHKKFGTPEEKLTLSNGEDVEVYYLTELVPNQSRKRQLENAGYMNLDPWHYSDEKTSYHIIHYAAGRVSDHYEISSQDYDDWLNAMMSQDEKRTYSKTIKNKYIGVFTITKDHVQVAKEFFKKNPTLLEPVYELVEIPRLEKNESKTKSIYEALSNSHRIKNGDKVDIDSLTPFYEFSSPPQIKPNWEKTKIAYRLLKDDLNLLPLDATREYDKLVQNYINKIFIEKTNQAKVKAEKRISLRNAPLLIGQLYDIVDTTVVTPTKYMTYKNNYTFYDKNYYDSVVSKLNRYNFSYITSMSSNYIDWCQHFIEAIAARSEHDLVLIDKMKGDRYVDLSIQFSPTRKYSAEELLKMGNTSELQEILIKKMNAEKKEYANELHTAFMNLPMIEAQIDFLSIEVFKSMKKAGEFAFPFATAITSTYPKYKKENAEKMLIENISFFHNATQNLNITSGLKSKELN